MQNKLKVIYCQDRPKGQEQSRGFILEKAGDHSERGEQREAAAREMPMVCAFAVEPGILHSLSPPVRLLAAPLQGGFALPAVSPWFELRFSGLLLGQRQGNAMVQRTHHWNRSHNESWKSIRK